MSIWYLLHLGCYGLWIVGVMVQIGLEIIGWRKPDSLRNIVDINYRIDLYLKNPLFLGILISSAQLFEPDNLQFETYNIMLFAQAAAVVAGTAAFIPASRRKSEIEHCDEKAAQKLGDPILRYLLTALPAIFLSVAAEIHIETNWIYHLLHYVGF